MLGSAVESTSTRARSAPVATTQLLHIARGDYYRIGELPLLVGIDTSIEFTEVGLGEPVGGVVLCIATGQDRGKHVHHGERPPFQSRE